MAFAANPSLMLQRSMPAATCPSSRAPLTALTMAKKKAGGGKKAAKPKKTVTPPSGKAAAPPKDVAETPAPAAAAKEDAPVAAPTPTPAPKAETPKADTPPKKAAAIPKSAIVDDSGVDDPEVMGKAVEVLNAGRPTLGDGLGFGPGEPVTFVGTMGEERTLGENERRGYSGDVSIVKATSKTVTVRLEGKFYGTRQWAFDSVAALFADKMPGVKVVVEDEYQLRDLYLKDVFYGEQAWALRKVGPQFVNERGIQVAQPVSPDGRMRDLDELTDMGAFDGSALQLGIEEMMEDALRQSKGATFADDRIGNLDKELAGSQTAYFSESGSESSSISLGDDDDNIESVTKVPLTTGQGAAPMSNVDKVMEGNPMFQKMTDMLSEEEGAMEEIQEMLNKSNGNMFSIMTNPKFQKLAQKMMANPELMQMMQDPAQVDKAMKSAQNLGITDSMGINVPKGTSDADATKGLTDNALDIVKGM
eukprot:CAMPEP_0173409082 /NCGR_PEP_ID=MMETSP1356-20130122/71327_1 /TAXON_ID=77927 ORGANISM="Hemiselmis virescens, Strain PCC157" /NCGR_SAMPLE_ID=MMETSP1356 /ASSEMBLY_ACC=CAM_ASM_000847 /LENGTH=475 /DNA_ID=CAMNT_0014370495 /DNA_START=21 /DNA_END=1445 /DNA_ORIENTATION=-